MNQDKRDDAPSGSTAKKVGATLLKGDAVLYAKNRVLNPPAPFSPFHLIEEMEDAGFEHGDASYAVTTLKDANWQYYAVLAARAYDMRGSYSHAGMIRMLEQCGYRPEDASHAVAALGKVDWEAHAIRSAKGWVHGMELSKLELIELLNKEGFTPEQVAVGVDVFDEATWSRQALRAAARDLRYESGGVNPAEMIKDLERQGFTPEQAEGARKVFVRISPFSRILRYLKK